jgi:hypothetical protein
MMATIPGSIIRHAVISDECRTGHGDQGVADEALARAKESIELILNWWAQGSGAKVHVVVTLEKPEQ